MRAGTPLVQIDPDASAGRRAQRRGKPRRHRGGRRVLAATGQAARGAGRRRRDQPAGVRAGAELAATAEAKLAALDAQVSEERVQLGYYRVDAPQDGIVGDIAVRAGDRVTNSTVITTIDDNSGARGVHPGAARSRARSAARARRFSCSMPTARSWRPTRSPSSRRASTTRRSRCSRRARSSDCRRRVRVAAVHPRARSSGARRKALTVPVTAVDADQRPVLLLRRRVRPAGRARRAPAAGAGRRARRQRLRRHRAASRPATA